MWFFYCWLGATSRSAAVVSRVLGAVPTATCFCMPDVPPAGFCGETEEEHLATVDLLRNTRYDNAFLFSYSERAKTYASRHYPGKLA